VALPVSDQRLQRTMALVSREDRALPPAARALRDFLEHELVQAWHLTPDQTST
jgi:DNA-binding transcriptional LysR family regulator